MSLHDCYFFDRRVDFKIFQNNFLRPRVDPKRIVGVNFVKIPPMIQTLEPTTDIETCLNYTFFSSGYPKTDIFTENAITLYFLCYINISIVKVRKE